jgi:hypothetical protein
VYFKDAFQCQVVQQRIGQRRLLQKGNKKEKLKKTHGGFHSKISFGWKSGEISQKISESVKFG